ncbi:MAG TPA: hypothetical protein VKY85_13690 [Candidatus Angelobacter sp.]|nr:hypothetical protein [Candidatus Angelobacter sp.]
MNTYSSRQAAQLLRIPVATLSKYIVQSKIPTPKSVTTGGITVHLWTDGDVERVRQLLPKIKNGRKTRYQKKRQDETKRKTKKKPPPRAAVPHKQLKNKQSKHPASTSSPAKYPAATSTQAK